MDAKLIFACLALGGLVSCAASAPAGPSPEATAVASHDPNIGKDFWTVMPVTVSRSVDHPEDRSELPTGTHFKVVGIEQGVAAAGSVRIVESGVYYYRIALDDGRTAYFYSLHMTGSVSDAPAENLAKTPDREIVSRIIEESRRSYAGRCGCPDDRTYDGRACGARSAYAHKVGIKCYPADVTRGEIADYRAKPHFRSVQ